MNDRQQRFVAEYLIDQNATKAATRAGYAAHTAKQQGSRLLTKVDIQNAIRRQQAVHINRLDIKAERVLNEVATMAFATLDDAEPVSAREKLRALELLMRHFGLLEPGAHDSPPMQTHLTSEFLGRLPQEALERLADISLEARRLLDTAHEEMMGSNRSHRRLLKPSAFGSPSADVSGSRG